MFIILGGILFILPVALIITDIVFVVKKKKSFIFELIAFPVGVIYMMLAGDLWSPPKYNEPINLWSTDFDLVHEPFSRDHILTLFILAAVGFISYLVLKFKREHMPPLAKVFCIAGIYGGITVNVLFIFQMMCLPKPEGVPQGTVVTTSLLFICTEYIVPVLFLIHVTAMFMEFVREQAGQQDMVDYGEKGFLAKCNRFLGKGKNMYWAALAAMIPLYGIIIAILCLFGQKPDSFIRVFTDTSDWMLSQKISPPPIKEDGHYLCTVSLRGHRKLVKPIRYGIRGGEKIVVNRQLCVANAFEQLLEERTPRFHRAVRRFYDTYGYPISRWIKNPWSADVVYLLMKPLEWIFVITLYLFDEKPENRIAGQYLPKGWNTGKRQ